MAAAKTLWAPAVNNAGQWGRWAITEVDDPGAVKAKIAEMKIPEGLPIVLAG